MMGNCRGSRKGRRRWPTTGSVAIWARPARRMPRGMSSAMSWISVTITSAMPNSAVIGRRAHCAFTPIRWISSGSFVGARRAMAATRALSALRRSITRSCAGGPSWRRSSFVPSIATGGVKCLRASHPGGLCPYFNGMAGRFSVISQANTSARSSVLPKCHASPNCSTKPSP